MEIMETMKNNKRTMIHDLASTTCTISFVIVCLGELEL